MVAWAWGTPHTVTSVGDAWQMALQTLRLMGLDAVEANAISYNSHLALQVNRDITTSLCCR